MSESVPSHLEPQRPGAQGLYGLLAEAATRAPDNVYLAEADRQLTFREADLAARKLAGWLQSRGVNRGDRVAICARNRAEIAIGIFATSLLGGIFVVLNSQLRPHGLGKILRQAEPKAVVADRDTRPLFDEVELPACRLLIDPTDEEDSGWTSWEEALSTAPALPQDHWEGIDVDPVCLVFTSGSTADPRGVTLTHDNIRFVTEAIQDRLGYRPDDVVGGFLPLAFDYGLYQIFLTALSGARLFIGDPRQVGPRLPALLTRAEISVLPGVPAIYAGLMALFDRRPFELPRLRAITNTGERLPLAYIARMEAMFPGLEVFPMYGLTECKRVSILRHAERSERPDSVGRALAGTEVFTVDPEGRRLAPGETGELVVRGRHVALGYWRAPEETARRFRKPAPEAPVQLHTGDHGSVDADGYLYFASRADDLLKHRGNRISPVEIEAEACAVEGILEAALFKRESDDTLHLFVTISESTLTPELILERLGQRLEPAKIPDQVQIELEFPKSLNGKIDRKALKAQLESTTSPSHDESTLAPAGR